MGYESTLFVNEIDEEFHCTICTMVLETPLQSPCEHIFCNECIKGWLKVEESCPIDRCFLHLDDLKPTPRYFRNMLDKFKIRCSFEPKGCQTIIPLEHLQDHLSRCIYNPDTEINCDKGCNLKVTRREYEENNCFTHLADKVRRQQEEIIKLSKEVGHQQEITKHIDNWQVCDNMKISINQPNILEFGGDSDNAYAQSSSSLEPANSYFKAHILNVGKYNSIAIGLTRKGFTTYVAPGYNEGFVSYTSTGELWIDKRTEKIGQKWKNGDIVECGIKFPSNSLNESAKPVELYFSVNEQLLTTKNVKIPHDGFFPIVLMFGLPDFLSRSHEGTVAKIEYLRN